MIKVIDIDSQLKDVFTPVFTQLCSTYLSSNGKLTKRVKTFVDKELTTLWINYPNNISIKAGLIKEYEGNLPDISQLSEKSKLSLKQGFKHLNTRDLEILIINTVIDEFINE